MGLLCMNMGIPNGIDTFCLHVSLPGNPHFVLCYCTYTIVCNFEISCQIMPVHCTRAVANSLLEKLFDDQQTVNSAKLQKLIYFAHGWHLAITGTPLLDEQVQAFPFGVVISSIYHQCREFGISPIISLLKEFDIESSKWVEPQVAGDDFVDSLLDKIVEQYGHLSASQLSNKSHGHGTPWAETWGNGQRRDKTETIIEDEIIREHFRQEINKIKPAGKTNLLHIKIGDIVIDSETFDDRQDELTALEMSEYAHSSTWPSFKKGDRKWKKIKEYAVLWNTSKQKGIIKLTLIDNVDYKIVVTSSHELELLANIFRHEKTVYYNLTSGSIASGWIPLSKET